MMVIFKRTLLVSLRPQILELASQRFQNKAELLSPVGLAGDVPF